MRKRTLILLIVFFSGLLILPAQQQRVDSLEKRLSISTREDTVRLGLLAGLCKHSEGDASFRYGEEATRLADKLLSANPGRQELLRIRHYKAQLCFDIAFIYQQRGEITKAVELVEKGLGIYSEQRNQKGIAEGLNDLGFLYTDQGNINKGLEYYEKSAPIAEAIGDKRGLAATYANIGNIYKNQGNVSLALEFFGKSLALREAVGDKGAIAESYVNIGMLHKDQEDLESALDYFKKSLKLREEIGDKGGIAVSLNNIGLIYRRRGMIGEALDYYSRSLKIREELGDKRSIAVSLNNLGIIYTEQGIYPLAADYLQRSLRIRKEIGNKEGMASTFSNLSSLLLKQKDHARAKAYADSALKISEEMGWVDGLKSAENMLSKIASAKGDFEGALEHYKKFIVYRDSLVNEANTRKTVQDKMQYDFDKKDALAKLEQDRKDTLAAADKRRQEIITWSVSIGFVLVLLLMLAVYRNNIQKRKANKIILEQKGEVEKQKQIIEERNRDITDSINYAKRIQAAKLPELKSIAAALPGSFVLFKPKDIVSGDFYYFQKNGNKVFIAAADCTGHGVPGALMSMIGFEKLDEALARSGDTGEILKLLNRGVKLSLRQTGGDDSTYDGMDIALCRFDTGTNQLSYSGANRPLWLLRGGEPELTEVKATKKAIGGYTGDDQDFETETLQLRAGDTFYIFSDGYADSFHGGNGKKLTTRKFKELLFSIRDKSMQEQEKYLDDFIEEWKAGSEQIDDILVIGVRI